MSMYADLLAASCDQPMVSADEHRDVGLLLARAIASRRGLSTPPGSGAGPEGNLAANIDYDLALLRLCLARGIDADPRRFDRPIEERGRLEAELAKRGIDLAELGPADVTVRSPQRGSVVQEPDVRPTGLRK